MRLTVYQDDPGVASAVDIARGLVLPWSAVRRYVTRHDLDGQALHAALRGSGWTLAGVELDPLSGLDAAGFERETDDAYMQMQIAERIGAPLAILASAHAGLAGADIMADAVTRLAALAERMDVRLCLRNAADSAAEQVDALRRIFDRAESPALGLCLDNLACVQAVQNPADAVLAFADRLAAVRLRDEMRERACAPGSGRGHVAATLAALADEGFAGPVIVDAAWAVDVAERFADYWR